MLQRFSLFASFVFDYYIKIFELTYSSRKKCSRKKPKIKQVKKIVTPKTF